MLPPLSHLVVVALASDFMSLMLVASVPRKAKVINLSVDIKMA